ncbi:MAG: hypothetical protein ACLQJR_09190 [Stellaceae bacterium]
MRKRLKGLPRGVVDTIAASEITGLSVSTLQVYRGAKFARFGPPWHVLDNKRPVYFVAELQQWMAARAAKARADAERLERQATALSDADAAALREIVS